MKRTSHLFMLALVLIAPLQKQQVWTANIDQIRRVARMIPGGDPLRINVLKFAESRRAKKFSVKGAPDEPSVQARTVFQVNLRPLILNGSLPGIIRATRRI